MNPLEEEFQIFMKSMYGDQVLTRNQYRDMEKAFNAGIICAEIVGYDKSYLLAYQRFEQLLKEDGVK